MPKLVDEGENHFQQILWGNIEPDATTWLGLYDNTTEPPEEATLLDISEISGGGYARKALVRGNWTITGNLATYPQQTFSFTADIGYVYGYFIATSEDNTGKLLFVHTFSDGPYEVKAGQEIKITPKIRVD